jgi:hypothetical protein
MPQLDEQIAILRDALTELVKARHVLEKLDGPSALTDGREPSALGYVVSAIGKVSARLELLARR